MRGLGAAVLVVLVVAAAAAGATLHPSLSHVSLGSPTRSGEKLTAVGTNLDRLSSLRIGKHRLRFTVVSPTEITATVPPGSEQATRIHFVFARITLNWKRVCKGCTTTTGSPAAEPI